LAAPARAWLHYVVVDQDLQCGQEGVQFFAHTLILNALLPHLRQRHATIFTESII
jgi:hypothetical protein